MYHHEIPGGQLSNLRQQAIALGLGEKFEQIEDMYAAANRMLGNLVKVTPSSKVVGDLALHLVAVGADPRSFEADPGTFDVPDSVIGFLRGELATRPAAGRSPSAPGRWRVAPGRQPAASVTAEQSAGLAADRRGTLNELLFPGPTKRVPEHRETYGDMSVLRTHDYLYGLSPARSTRSTLGQGVTLLIGLEAIGEPDERGIRTVCARSTASSGRSACATSVATDGGSPRRRTPPTPDHVAAPLTGVVRRWSPRGTTVRPGRPWPRSRR